MKLRTLQFKKEDYQGLLKVEPKFEDFLTALNQENKTLEAILNAGVRLSDNLFAFTKTLDFQTGASTAASFPLKMQNTLAGGSKPVGVILLNALDTTTTAAPVALGNPAWSTATGQVLINDIYGITINKKYRVAFLVIGG